MIDIIIYGYIVLPDLGEGFDQRIQKLNQQTHPTVSSMLFSAF